MCILAFSDAQCSLVWIKVFFSQTVKHQFNVLHVGGKERDFPEKKTKNLVYFKLKKKSSICQ